MITFLCSTRRSQNCKRSRTGSKVNNVSSPLVTGTSRTPREDLKLEVKKDSVEDLNIRAPVGQTGDGFGCRRRQSTTAVRGPNSIKAGHGSFPWMGEGVQPFGANLCRPNRTFPLAVPSTSNRWYGIPMLAISVNSSKGRLAFAASC